MKDNLEMIKELISKDINSILVFLEWLKIINQKRESKILIKFKNGQITRINTDRDHILQNRE